MLCRKIFGGIKATIKSLKDTVDILHYKDMRELVETQRVMDEVVVAKADKINRIKSEMIIIKAITEPIKVSGKKVVDDPKNVCENKKTEKDCSYFFCRAISWRDPFSRLSHSDY